MPIGKCAIFVLSQRDGAHTCANHGWQATESPVDVLACHLLRVLTGRHIVGSCHMIVVAFAGNAQLYRRTQLLQVNQFHVDVDFLVSVQGDVLDVARMAIGDVELQVGDCLLRQVA